MPDIYVGQQAVFPFQVRDLNDTPVTGLSQSHFDFSLQRRSGDNVFEPAAEIVSIVERGGGAYEARFSPDTDASGWTYWLDLVELASFPASAQNRHDFFATAGSVGEAHGEEDAFCALGDVAAITGGPPFDETLPPTQGQVLDWMAWHAAQIQARMATVGSTLTVPSGNNPITTSAEASDTIRRLARMANSFLAAGNVIYAREVRDNDDVPRARALWKQGAEVLDQLATLLDKTREQSGIRTHLATGGVAAADFANGGYDRPASDLYSLRRRW